MNIKNFLAVQFPAFGIDPATSNLKALVHCAAS